MIPAGGESIIFAGFKLTVMKQHGGHRQLSG
jgi:hypothetical protein